jgi:hypothetical protein
MTLTGPDTYELKISGGKHSVVAPYGQPHFVAPATLNVPKLYVVSRGSSLSYVGVTLQPMTSRLRGGMLADGLHGYHGYAWKKVDSLLRLDIWYLQGVEKERASNELETIEAEVVYLSRIRSGQWPTGQTEIHFHQSKDVHRTWAKRILDKIRK